MTQRSKFIRDKERVMLYLDDSRERLAAYMTDEERETVRRILSIKSTELKTMRKRVNRIPAPNFHTFVRSISTAIIDLYDIFILAEERMAKDDYAACAPYAYKSHRNRLLRMAQYKRLREAEDKANRLAIEAKEAAKLVRILKRKSR